MSPIAQTIVYDFIVPVASAALSIAAGIAIHALRKWLETQTFITKNAALKDEIDRLADDSVDYTEEIANQMQKISGEKLESKKKEEMALNVLLSSAKDHNLTVARARELVLIALGNKRFQ